MLKKELISKVEKFKSFITPVGLEYNEHGNWYELKVEGSEVASEVDEVLEGLKDSGEYVTTKLANGSELKLVCTAQSEKRSYLKFVEDTVVKF